MNLEELVNLWRAALPAEIELVVQTVGIESDVRLRFEIHDQACRIDISELEPNGPWVAELPGSPEISTLEDCWHAIALEFARRLNEAREALTCMCESSPSNRP